MYAELDPLFATDLFFLFPNFRDSEVPAVNKPRRACLYVASQTSRYIGRLKKIMICSELFSPDLNWDWEMILIIRTFAMFPFKGRGFFYALISTSTPEGKSNLLSASTVLEEEV